MQNGDSDGTEKRTVEELEEDIRRQTEVIQRINSSYALLQARTRTILTSLPLGLLVLDDRLTIQAVNNIIERLFGFSPRELAGNSIDKLFSGNVKQLFSISAADSNPSATGAAATTDDAAPTASAATTDDAAPTGAARPSQTGVSSTRREMAGNVYTALGKDGRAIPCELFVNEIQDGDKKVIFVHVNDVTERERLNQLRKDFLAMVSHDLRTPLASISMLMTMLGEDRFGKMEERAYEAVGRGRQNAEFLMKLVNDLLEAERLEQGDIELALSETTASNIVESALRATEGAAAAASVSIERRIEDCNLIADENRLVQVLNNLIANAVKFSPPQTVVTVAASNHGGTIVFEVSDKGPGIPASARGEIFERYKQLKQPKTTKKQGFGLGLSICKKLVEAHGGKISVESDEGEGATFIVSIPLKQKDC